MAERIWELWFVPTEKGVKAFNWSEKKLGETFRSTKEDADLACYLESKDDPAPDINEYRKIQLRELAYVEGPLPSVERTVNLDQLKAAAEKAGGREWFTTRVTHQGLRLVDDGLNDGIFPISAESPQAEFIAAASPSVILELVARLKKSEGAI